jgi:hypothetical protein
MEFISHLDSELRHLSIRARDYRLFFVDVGLEPMMGRMTRPRTRPGTLTVEELVSDEMKLLIATRRGPDKSAENTATPVTCALRTLWLCRRVLVSWLSLDRADWNLCRIDVGVSVEEKRPEKSPIGGVVALLPVWRDRPLKDQ